MLKLLALQTKEKSLKKITVTCVVLDHIEIQSYNTTMKKQGVTPPRLHNK